MSETDSSREMPRADLVRVDIAKLEAKVDVHFATLGGQVNNLSKQIDGHDHKLQDQDHRIDQLWDWRNTLMGSISTVRWMATIAALLGASADIAMGLRAFGILK